MRLLALLLAALTLSCGGDDVQPPASQPAPQPSWVHAFDTSGAGSLSGVWGSGPEDVFIVGGGEDGAEIYHFDGDSWTKTTLADVPLLIWAYGFAADNVYAVGLAGTMVHFDGSQWSRIETGITTHLWGIFGFTRDDLWIVGGDPFEGDPIILHYDGLTFEVRQVEAEDNPNGAHALFKVWGIGEHLHAVGQKGLIMSYQQKGWSAVDAGSLADQDFVSLWGTSEDHIWAVGGRSSARIASFDGHSWQTDAPADLPGLNAIHMADPAQAIIGGVAGFAGRYAPQGEGAVRELNGVTHLDVHAIWGDGAGRHYAVGGSFAKPHVGTALVRTLTAE